MGNMSYCRFENTLGDLHDCYNNMSEHLEDKSAQEIKARRFLIQLCCDIALAYGDEVDRNITAD